MISRRNLLYLFTIILIAINLRPAITGVGPLIYEIRDDTGLSNTLLGFLTTLPLLVFAFFSAWTSAISRKFGMEATMTAAFVLLTIGIFLRIVPSHLALFAGTVILGVGITFGNVLLPGITRKYFPDRFGTVTGIYAAMMGFGAATGSGVSVPLSEGLNLGWRGSLGFWGILSIVGLLAWLPRLRNNEPAGPASGGLLKPLRELSRSRLAWAISVFMGLQSLTFYACVAWLPEILIERGMTPAQAGWLMFLSQIIGMISTLIIPPWGEKLHTQEKPILLILISELISIAGLLLPFQSPFLTGFWVSLMGIGLGSSYGVILLIIGLRTRSPEAANELSGMSQAIGYILAATGPILFGALYDLTLNWSIPLVFLFLIAVLKLWTGLYAAGDRRI